MSERKLCLGRKYVGGAPEESIIHVCNVSVQLSRPDTKSTCMKYMSSVQMMAADMLQKSNVLKGAGVADTFSLRPRAWGS